MRRSTILICKMVVVRSVTSNEKMRFHAEKLRSSAQNVRKYPAEQRRVNRNGQMLMFAETLGTDDDRG